MGGKEHVIRRYQDQYYCQRCGKSWDVDDKTPPDCEEKKE